MNEQALETLARRARRRDRVAVEALYSFFYGVMLRYLGRRYPSFRGPAARPLCQEIVQDVWVDLVRPGGSIDRFDPARGRFDSYVFTILDRAAIDYLRKRSTQKRRGVETVPDTAEGLENLHSDAGRSVRDVEQRDLLEAIFACLKGALKTEDFLVFQMAFVDEAEVPEIAVALDCQLSNVYKRLKVIEKEANRCAERHGAIKNWTKSESNLEVPCERR